MIKTLAAITATAALVTPAALSSRPPIPGKILNLAPILTELDHTRVGCTVGLSLGTNLTDNSEIGIGISRNFSGPFTWTAYRTSGSPSDFHGYRINKGDNLIVVRYPNNELGAQSAIIYIGC